MKVIKIDYALPLIHPTATIERDGQKLTVEFDDLQTELLDTISAYDRTYVAKGVDKYGRKYSATAVFSCDELIELDDIDWIP
jgi:hypothetical protein